MVRDPSKRLVGADRAQGLRGRSGQPHRFWFTDRPHALSESLLHWSSARLTPRALVHSSKGDEKMVSLERTSVTPHNRQHTHHTTHRRARRARI